jgi:hypothetical protein
MTTAPVAASTISIEDQLRAGVSLAILMDAADVPLDPPLVEIESLSIKNLRPINWEALIPLLKVKFTRMEDKIRISIRDHRTESVQASKIDLKHIPRQVRYFFRDIKNRDSQRVLTMPKHLEDYLAMSARYDYQQKGWQDPLLRIEHDPQLMREVFQLEQQINKFLNE